MRVSKLRLIFVLCCVFCSIGAMRGQAIFSETVEGTNGVNAGCAKNSTTMLTISCSNSWVDQGTGTDGFEKTIAQNGFSGMSVYGYSSVTIFQQGAAATDDGIAEAIIEDTLSIIGLQGEPVAFLKLDFQCVQCWVYANPYIAFYAVQASTNGYNSGVCTVPSPGGNGNCILTVPIGYNVTQQPYPISIERNLYVDAHTSVINGAAGATITTTMCIGVDRCSAPATAQTVVVNAQGQIIKGVTVVGSSGHIYN